VVAGGEDQSGLDEQVESQRGEGRPDQAQAAALPFLAGARQFPDNNGGSAAWYVLAYYDGREVRKIFLTNP
jgi:hypothetical protein